MKLHMWGTRGSLPRPITHQTFTQLVENYTLKAEKAGIHTLTDFRLALRNGSLGHPLVYGGHTTCNEFRHGSQSFFVDMGTGFADSSETVLAQGQREVSVFMTHLHWDHIMGLPFFTPVYIPTTKLVIHHVHPHAPDYIRLQFNGVNFPVRWEDLRAKIEFRRIKMYDPMQFGDVTITSFALDHPGGSFGYRFDAAGHSMAVGVDGEYKRVTQEALGKDLPYYQNLDLLIFDGQYDLDELATRHDWGHCSPTVGVELALREGIRNIIMAHHDPRASEAKEERMLEQAISYRDENIVRYRDTWTKLNQAGGPNVMLAYDGLELELGSGPRES